MQICSAPLNFAHFSSHWLISQQLTTYLTPKCSPFLPICSFPVSALGSSSWLTLAVLRGMMWIWGIRGGLLKVKKMRPMVAEGQQTAPKTPSPGAARCPVPAPGYTSQDTSTALPHALVTVALKSSKLRSNLFSFPGAIHLWHMGPGIKAQHCCTRQFNLLSSPPYQRLGEHSHKLPPGACVPQHLLLKACSLASQNCSFY